MEDDFKTLEGKQLEEKNSYLSYVRCGRFVHQNLEYVFMHPSNRTRTIALVFSGNRSSQPESPVW